MRKTTSKIEQKEVSPGLHLTLPAIVAEDLFTLVHSVGMHALQQLLEMERTQLCGPRYEHAPESGQSAWLDARSVGAGRRRVRTAASRAVARRTRCRCRRGALLAGRSAGPARDGADAGRGQHAQITLARWSRCPTTSTTSELARARSVGASSNRRKRRCRNSFAASVRHSFLCADDRWRACRRARDAHRGGIDHTGNKHVLGVRQGRRKTPRPAASFLCDLRDRGLCTERSLLFVLDGNKGAAQKRWSTCSASGP